MPPCASLSGVLHGPLSSWSQVFLHAGRLPLVLGHPESCKCSPSEPFCLARGPAAGLAGETAVGVGAPRPRLSALSLEFWGRERPRLALLGLHVHLGPTSWGWGRGSRLCGPPQPQGACELSRCPDRVFCTDRKCGWAAITGLLLADQQVIHVTHPCLPRTLCYLWHRPPSAPHF